MDISVVLVGNNGVGKTSLSNRYANNTFKEEITTVGVGSRIMVVDLDGREHKIKLSDTAGQEKFRNITSSFYQGADAIIVVYDVTDYNSFISVAKWLQDVNKYAPNACIVLVGNKCDLIPIKQVDEKMAKDFADEKGFLFFETSCKEIINIEDVFNAIIRAVDQLHNPTKNANLQQSDVLLFSLSKKSRSSIWGKLNPFRKIKPKKKKNF